MEKTERHKHDSKTSHKENRQRTVRTQGPRKLKDPGKNVTSNSLNGSTKVT